MSRRKIILATARVKVFDSYGDSTLVRALLDQGSEASFVSESIVQLLELPKECTRVALTGLGTARSMMRLSLASAVDPDFRLQMDALVLPYLTTQIPAHSVIDLDIKHFVGLELTDPEFFVSRKVDIILGADVFAQLLRPGMK